jgi:hypothetical protein
MNSLRTFIYNILGSAPSLSPLGLTSANLYPNYSATPNAPTQDLFGVLRWGATEVGVGPVRTVNLSLWVYNRHPDYAPIQSVLMAVRAVLDSLVGQPASVAGGAWVLGVDWAGASEDLFDDGYNAYVRNESYRITASGN